VPTSWVTGSRWRTSGNGGRRRPQANAATAARP